MYPSSSSSSQRSMATSGLIRYGSAPGSLLTRAVDSVVGTNPELSTLGLQNSMGHHHRHHHYFSGDDSSISTESTCKANSPDPSSNTKEPKGSLQRSCGLNEMTVGDFSTGSSLKIDGGGGGGGGGGSFSPTSALVRQSSSPAGFLNYSASENGFSVTRGAGSYNNRGGFNGGHGISRLKPQLSFTRQDSSLSQISEVSENGVDGINSNNGGGHRDFSASAAAAHSYAPGSYGVDSWDNPNTIVFSNPPNKRAKSINGDFLNCLDSLETQFSMPQTSLEMATVEKLLQIPEDSVPWKTRAKRGCATHPRSIAERERRTRISGKLKKLQDLVPNMDKQTSYSDMLDLAVQHIKGLQNQVQKLNKELESCTCGCKNSHDVCQQ